MNGNKEKELSVLLLSLIGNSIELILFFKALEEENNDEIKDDVEKKELKKQIKDLSDRVGKLEKAFS